MAQALRERLGADCGMSLTGVPGPSAVEGTPVGVASLAMASAHAVTAQARRVPPRRMTITRRVSTTARIALCALRNGVRGCASFPPATLTDTGTAPPLAFPSKAPGNAVTQQARRGRRFPRAPKPLQHADRQVDAGIHQGGPIGGAGGMTVPQRQVGAPALANLACTPAPASCRPAGGRCPGHRRTESRGARGRGRVPWSGGYDTSMALATQ